MTTMTRWSPYMPRLHFHHHHDVNGLFPRFFDDAPDEAAQPAASWLPAAEGRLEHGTYVIQLALPGVDPKDVEVSLMDNVLTVKGERKADPDSAGKDYFVREVGTAHSSGASRSPRASTPPTWRPRTRTACSRCGSPRRARREG